MGLNGHSAAKLVKNTRQAFLISKQIKQVQIMSAFKSFNDWKIYFMIKDITNSILIQNSGFTFSDFDTLKKFKLRKVNFAMKSVFYSAQSKSLLLNGNFFSEQKLFSENFFWGKMREEVLPKTFFFSLFFPLSLHLSLSFFLNHFCQNFCHTFIQRQTSQ